MKLHEPEKFHAHRIRTKTHLEAIAKMMGCDTIEEAQERNWTMEIDNDIPPPPTEEAKPKRGRPRKNNKADKAPTSQADQLEAALSFVEPVYSELQDYSQYVSLVNKEAVMFNGQMAAGHPIVEELTLSPHLPKLIAALKRCGKTLTITETDAQQVSIKGDNIRALVPCFEYTVGTIKPDAPNINGSFDVLKEAFKVCGQLANENAERVVEASLLLDPYTCTGTNGKALIQYAHGISNLPPGTVLPKIFCMAVASCKKPIVGLGGTWGGEFLTSLTVWFEGGAWLRTQCYNDRWPDINTLMNVGTSPITVPQNFAEAIEAVEPFTNDNKAIHFVQEGIWSHATPEVGAQYDVPGMVDGKTLNADLLKRVVAHIKTIDLTSYPDKLYFFGGTESNPIRGCIAVMDYVK